MVRLFSLNNPKDYNVGLKTVITSLENENDFSMNGDFDQINKEIITFDQGKIVQIEGTLLLKQESTDFKIVFQGEITIQKEDSYVFRLICDDGAHLYIDDKRVIDNGGAHAFRAIMEILI